MWQTAGYIIFGLAYLVIYIRTHEFKHLEMTRGITLTEDQAEKLTKAFSERYRAKEDLNKTAPMRDDMAR